MPDHNPLNDLPSVESRKPVPLRLWERIGVDDLEEMTQRVARELPCRRSCNGAHTSVCYMDRHHWARALILGDHHA